MMSPLLALFALFADAGPGLPLSRAVELGLAHHLGLRVAAVDVQAWLENVGLRALGARETALAASLEARDLEAARQAWVEAALFGSLLNLEAG